MKEQGGMFLWFKIPISFNSAEELSDKILKYANVFITPGFIFGTQGDRYLRISLCSSIERLKKALSRIEENLINIGL